MDQCVVETAQHRAVVQAGGSAVDPELDVVDFRPAGGPVAAREHAPVVTKGDGPAKAGGPDAGGAADVQRFAGGAEDGGDDVAVAQQPPGVGGADGHPGRVEGGLPEAVGEGVEAAVDAGQPRAGVPHTQGEFGAGGRLV